jgi:hypothetical protein
MEVFNKFGYWLHCGNSGICNWSVGDYFGYNDMNHEDGQLVLEPVSFCE